MGAPFFRHWKDKGPDPVKPTEKTAGDPCKAIWLFGWLVMAGGVFTARTALLLVAVPTELGHSHREGGTVVGRSGPGVV